METIYIYPGSFSPPTYGHLAIARLACAVAPRLYIVCSRNEKKEERWFSEEECKYLWREYDLPPNAEVMTFDEILSVCAGKNIVMVRGIRDKKDAEEEKEVMLENQKRFGVRMFLYIFCEPAFRHISSTAARRLAREPRLQELSGYVCPRVITALLTKTSVNL